MSNETLHLAIEAFDEGYKLSNVSEKYETPTSSLRNHLIKRSIGKKMDPKTVLSNDEEQKICDYISFMVEWGHPMIPLQLKSKVVKIIQERITPIKDRIPRDS